MPQIRAVAVAVGVVAFFATYASLAFVIDSVVTFTSSRGETSISAMAAMLFVALVATFVGGATAARLAKQSPLPNAVASGLLAASYFIAVYALHGAIVAFLAPLSLVSVAGALAGGWILSRATRAG